jgi:fatty-acyl-CoA synthase
VLYSHRSNFLHTFMCLQADLMGIGQKDTVLPITPMFHANAWGMAFNAPAAGSKLVMCGARLDGASVHELLEAEAVTMSCAVPTVWQMLLQHLDATGERLSTLKRVLIGGAAVPEAMIRAFHDRYGVEVVHAWGMTEMSPLGTVGSPTEKVAAMPFEDQLPWRSKQGRAFLGVDAKLTDEAGRRLPHDGLSFGHLKVRGPAVAKAYYRSDAPILDEEGYFDTGDIATLDPDGYMQITDRAKDVIKSGGEWISSIDVENTAMGHPKAALTAVIGVPHPKWQERPLLLVKLKPGEQASEQEFLAFLDGKIAKWWMPDQVLFVDDIPLGATGKVDKKAIRAGMAGAVANHAQTAG